MGEDRTLITRWLGLADYQSTWCAMRDFTAARSDETADEIWLCQHPAVFTLGLAGKPEHLLRDIGVAMVKTDRGGQITYHGPGQLVSYLLVDLKRRNLTVKRMVNHIEQAVIDLLATYGVSGERRSGAPGVYVDGAKVAALGLKIKNGCSYHGLAVNVAMDLAPFAAINPCGYEGLQVTQLADLCGERDPDRVGARLSIRLQELL